ncbi:hypothetical protein [Burkholderia vietnamiensis]|uniref:hypothetical protein n=1 Tax=Burkholderia vietnamiensis TaxID=60552 RepID=UPI00075C171B|nr:hypothetical protein [Burkholderia vietnamiensis]KVF69024.1 hypothetical protein WJ17_12375 [Burkholderia vietnamiensis]MBR8202109.1 hypothetical protein [Burkholderia vietnamiensis]MCA8390883.1 hypothetical protein [Burkholderia vietnamiensis]GBH26707.1 hypothetical protein BvRS1_37560 [Burkholderia vietnamiensis]HDR8956766.1 hypothetical protein [Burkholderia vietnamiensis]
MTKKQRKNEAPTADTQIAAEISSTISAVSFQGLSIETPDGNPATLAVLDQNGRVVDAGPAVSRAVWDIAIRSYRNFLCAQGFLRVRTVSPDQQTA